MTKQITKKCLVCGKEFKPHSKRIVCCSKECSKIYSQNSYKYNEKRKEKILEKIKIYQQKNVDKIKQYKVEYSKKSQTIHKKICPICKKEFETTHSKKITCSDECKKIYKRKHTQEYLNNRNKNDIDFKLKVLCRQNLKRCFNFINTEKNIHTFDFLDYSPQELKEHLEKQFYDNINWTNYGEYWEIHHIKPLHTFNFIKDGNIDYGQLKLANSLNNLQPLTKKDHKLIHHSFSPISHQF